MTPSNPCQPMPWQYSQTPSTPSIRKGLGLGGSARLNHWQGCREDLASDANRETVRNFAISRGMHTDNGWHIWVIHPDALRAWDALNKAAVESPLIVLAGLK